MKKFMFFTIGLVAGLVNGILGTGGGTIVVPSIELLGVDTKKSHSTAIAIILPITAVSAFFYFRQGNIDLKSTVIVSIAGLLNNCRSSVRNNKRNGYRWGYNINPCAHNLSGF